ncbi:DUF6491 family protein [Gallaecimonas xiamenensis]|uniref:Lipoprotein n=1 Tax=Gallaecimonas xiamenensis 3-C-1 TaxID=745411 RepID=K2JD07_9GAMM|nr:DUF6491 family protein [Gallaecimonas xiamenensis]EKE68504.1 hypothetical protein B3C1_16872 [Gallaecimonas xiamenensis 3-C-1]
MKALRSLSLAALLALAGCASQSSEPLPWQQYTQGRPLELFNPRFMSFDIVNHSQVVLWQSPNRAVLMSVLGSCFFDPSQPVLKFTSGQASVRAHRDAVLYGGQRCPIQQIQDLDIRRMRQDGLLK